jgi:hypothetical protein
MDLVSDQKWMKLAEGSVRWWLWYLVWWSFCLHYQWVVLGWEVDRTGWGPTSTSGFVTPSLNQTVCWFRIGSVWNWRIVSNGQRRYWY